MPTWTIIHKRFWKVQVPYLARHYRVVTYDGPGNGRSDRPLDPAAYDHDRQVEYALAVLDATGTDRAVAGRAVHGLPTGRSTWPPTTPTRVLGTVLIGAVRADSARPARTAARSDWRTPPRLPRVPRAVRSGRDPLEHWAKYDRRLLAQRLRRLPVVLLRAVLPRAALDQADRGLRRLGPARPRPEVLVAENAARRARTPETVRGVVRRHRHARCPDHPRRRRPDQPARAQRSGIAELTGGELRDRRGRRAHPARPRPGEGQPPDPRLRRERFAPRPEPGTWRADERRPQAGALPLLADRPRPRPPRRRRSPRSCASGTPTSRSTGWPSTRSPGCSRRPASGCTRPAAGWPTSRGHIESESGEHDLHCFEALRRMDEILVDNFMVFDDVVRDERLRPRRRRRGLGRRPLPAREPRAQAVRLRLADRLRRLPADARRRRARGAAWRPTTTPR